MFAFDHDTPPFRAPAREAADFSEEEREEFRRAFSAREKDWAGVYLRTVIGSLVLPLLAGVSAMGFCVWTGIGNKSPLPVLVTVIPTIFLILYFKRWWCPCCRYDVEHDVGLYCPCCGKKSLLHTMGPKCQECGVALKWVWEGRAGRRKFTVHACSVCGLWLSDEGLGPEKTVM